VVTGGAGFIGSNFVRLALAETPDRVVVVDKLTYSGHRASLADVEKHPRFAFVEADIADAAAMKAVFQAHGPRAVLNFAAETHVDRSIDGPGAFVRTNINGTYELLEASRAHLAGLPAADALRFRFLHISTDEVYGSLGEAGLFSEETPYAPNSPYAASKAAADHLVRAWHETFRVPTLLTNCSNNYGPYQFPEKLIPLMILTALEGKPLPIYGDGGNVRDWLHVEDHCRGILLVLQKGVPGGKYNIGGGNERTNLQVVDTLCKILEGERPAPGNAAFSSKGISGYSQLKTFVPDRPGHDRRYAIDATRIRRELGWQPSYSFEEGLLRTVRWYLSNQDWCTAVQRGNDALARLGLAAPPAAPRAGAPE
ncbi:MAG TPA: dTDP-glucose 4,6-dehydratase, partial [Thermoanaerobaculia bacterium]|nr:dTDP-glucose 4,6-dehydratase [Thermoanaerobaculia bacterium]